MKNILKIMTLAIVMSCDLPCAKLSRVFDMGPIPEEVLGMLPYADNETVSFTHNSDSTVQAEVTRESQKQHEYYTDECTFINYVYEIDITGMTIADSSLSVIAWVANLNVINWYEVRINDSRFRIPASPESMEGIVVLDSLVVNDQSYYHVLSLPRNEDDPSNNFPVTADTLFYSYDAGFLKIVMDDGGHYEYLP